MKKTNLFKDIPEDLPKELSEILASSKTVRIERIVSRGQCSPKEFYYDQEQNEFVLLLKGEAELEIFDQDEKITLGEGDSILITAHQKHRVSWTNPDIETIWLAVFY